MHYNEFQAVQLAKKLMAEEDDDDEASDGKEESSKVSGQGSNPKPVNADETNTSVDPTNIPGSSSKGHSKWWV